MLKKAKRSGRNIWKSLLDWRNTPTVSMGSSPVQRLLSRRTRHSLPLSKPLLKPHVIENVPQMLKDKRAKSKTQYDENAEELPNLISGQSIRMKPSPGDYSKKWRYGTCVSEVGTRSYVVDVDGNQYRRNRRDLRSTREPTDSNAGLRYYHTPVRWFTTFNARSSEKIRNSGETKRKSAKKCEKIKCVC